jgi:hypothetical protein
MFSGLETMVFASHTKDSDTKAMVSNTKTIVEGIKTMVEADH